MSGVEQWQRERRRARACIWSTKTGFQTTSLSRLVPARVDTHREKWIAFFLNMRERVYGTGEWSGCPAVPFRQFPNSTSGSPYQEYAFK